jgi:hypothetical protein
MLDSLAPEALPRAKQRQRRRGQQSKQSFHQLQANWYRFGEASRKLLNYSFQEGVKLAILTNGIAWWFYLPRHEGSGEYGSFSLKQTWRHFAKS